VKRFLLFLLPIVVLGQEPQMRNPPHTIRASGEADVSAKPDQARLSVSVVVQASTAGDAVAQDATKSTAVTAALKKVVGTNGEIQSTNYSIEPQYRYAPNQNPVLTGYQGTHTLTVTLNDVTLVGSVIDESTKAGANQVERIEFTLKDDADVRQQAIGKAATIARQNGEAIAKALGLTVAGVYSAEITDGGGVRPFVAPMMKRNMVAMAAPAPPTDVQSGNLQVHASVTVLLEVR
jgi:uncharacterized protein